MDHVRHGEPYLVAVRAVALAIEHEEIADLLEREQRVVPSAEMEIDALTNLSDEGRAAIRRWYNAQVPAP